MSLWRFTRDEMTGAWRSLRYDLSRRANERGWQIGPATVGDRTGTTRSPRLVAAAAFAIVAVGGSAGSYLAVVNGVGSLMDEPAGPEPYPLVAEAAPQAALPTPTLVARRGDGTAVAPGRVTVVTVTVSPPVTTAPVAAVAPQRQTAGATTPPARLPGTPTRPGSPARTTTPPTPCCLNPPVPTPTSPPSSAPSGSPTGDPSPTAEPTGPVTTTPAPDASSTPADTDGHQSGGPDDDRDHEDRDRDDRNRDDRDAG